jgi:HK97 family phage major capsid protein
MNIETEKKQILKTQEKMIDLVKAEGREDFTVKEQAEFSKLESRYEYLVSMQQNAGRQGRNLFQQEDPMGENRAIASQSGIILGEYRTEDLKRFVESRGYGWSDGTTRRANYNKYLKLGLNGLREEETRDLMMDVSTKGGFAITPVSVAMEYITDLNEVTPLRNQARKELMEHAHTLRIADITDPQRPQWTEELSAGPTDSTMAYSGRDYTPHPIAMELLVSKKQVRARPDTDNLVRERSIEQMSQALEEAYFVGSGSNQPLGIFTASSMGIPESQDVETATTALKGDDLYNCIKSLPKKYRRGARWFASREFEYRVSTLKSGDGNYLFSPSLEKGTPGSLLGYPLEISDFAPGDDWASGDYIACLGSPSNYLVVDAMSGFQVQVLIEKYAHQNRNAYHIRFETDGNIVRAESWVRLKLK